MLRIGVHFVRLCVETSQSGKAVTKQCILYDPKLTPKLRESVTNCTHTPSTRRCKPVRF